MNNKLINHALCYRELVNSFCIVAIMNYINFIILKEDKSTSVIPILLQKVFIQVILTHFLKLDL